MTQQFKFGDMVRHPNFDSPCVFLCQLYDTETKEKTWAIVLNENEYDRGTQLATQQFVTPELLTLIQHPDTARLDWVTKKLQTSHVGIMIDDAGAIIYGENVPSYEVDFKAMEGSGHTIREAIDNAMQRQSAE